MITHDVTIYSPKASLLYERGSAQTGGAERQTALLAQGLAARGLDVAHVVLPVRNPVPPPVPGITVVSRAPYGGDTRVMGLPLEARSVWRAMAQASARVYVFRMGSPVLGLAALFCRAHKRRLVFSSANNLDFTFESLTDTRVKLEAYRFGVRRADAVVVQTEEQVELARGAFPDLPRVMRISSFAEPAEGPPVPPVAFLWIGRLVPYKEPQRYLDLAEALPEAKFRMIGIDFRDHLDLAADVRRRAGTIPNLELIEPQPRERAMRLVEEAVALVNTSRLEGMPNVFLEAWAREVPVLTLSFDPDGRVTEHDLGVSAEGSWERFLAGARRLWEARDRRSALWAHTRVYVEMAHGLEAVTGRWLELIEELDGRVADPARQSASNSR
jgi:glycosyltransferase involved in cell wall biosynthesis